MIDKCKIKKLYRLFLLSGMKLTIIDDYCYAKYIKLPDYYKRWQWMGDDYNFLKEYIINKIGS